MIGLDTSFLVGLSIREHPAHSACWRLFETDIRGREGSAALSSQVVAEFVHVVTDPRRFTQPLSMDQALDITGQWWHAVECVPVASSDRAVAVFMDWMGQYRLGRKRVLDTLLAASYHCAGVVRIASTNWRDFAVFGVFEPVELA